MRLMRDLIDDQMLRSVQLWADVAALAEYQAASTVMAFAATSGEPDTTGLFARLKRDGKTLVLPRVVDSGMEAAEVGGGLVPGAFGIASPAGPAVSPASIGLVLVPGLAFMVDGTRLGQGGGHYDRFLATCTAPSVGVCFAEQLLDELPFDAHDIRVSRVLAA
jgi:5-formyltetrahydrofolate cyclo-ligase